MMDTEAQQVHFEECCRNHLGFLTHRFGCKIQSKVFPVGIMYANQFVDIKVFTESYGSRLSVWFLECRPEMANLSELTRLRNCSLDYVVPLDLPSRLLRTPRKRNPTVWDTNAERYLKAAYELAIVHAGTCLRECASDVLSGDLQILSQLKQIRTSPGFVGSTTDRQLRPVVDLLPM